MEYNMEYNTMWKQNLHLNWAISDVFLYPIFADCVHAKAMFIHVSEREIFFSRNWRQSCRRMRLES